MYIARRRRRRYELPGRPIGVDIVIGVDRLWRVLAAVGLVANDYPSPITGKPTGIANPVAILIIVTLVMTYLASRRRFGRYVYAYGGNPEAAELGGINARPHRDRHLRPSWAILAAVSAAIQTARLNAAVTNLGVQNELDVIAAAVIGGTSFSGGIGTIPGAVLGAVVMQSLRSGMVLLGDRLTVAGHRRGRGAGRGGRDRRRAAPAQPQRPFIAALTAGVIVAAHHPPDRPA